MPSEPSADNPESVHVVIKLPTGKRLERRFLQSHPLEVGSHKSCEVFLLLSYMLIIPITICFRLYFFLYSVILKHLIDLKLLQIFLKKFYNVKITLMRLWQMLDSEEEKFYLCMTWRLKSLMCILDKLNSFII